MDRKLTEKEQIERFGSPKRDAFDEHYQKTKKRVIWTLFFVFLFLPVLLDPIQNNLQGTFSSASKSSEFIPTDEAIVRVYAARTWGAKGILAVHSWIAMKRKGEKSFQVNQVIGWKRDRNGNVLWRQKNVPYDSWWGNEASLLLEKRGEGVEGLINQIDAAINAYPYKNEYVLFPGPNSNSFVAWVGLQVPEMGLDLPSTAIGKDWRPLEKSLGMSSSGTGLQASLMGLLGTSIGLQEGLEVNVLGLNFEIDLLDLAIELPLFGRYDVWYLLVYLLIGYLVMRRVKLAHLNQS